MTFTLVIKDESAAELFRIGAENLKEFYLPKYFNTPPEDVVTCRFDDVVLEDVKNG